MKFDQTVMCEYIFIDHYILICFWEVKINYDSKFTTKFWQKVVLKQEGSGRGRKNLALFFHNLYIFI